MPSIMNWINWCKRNVCYSKNCVILCCEWHNFFGKRLYICTIDLSHHSAHKNIKIQLRKNEVYKIYYVICQDILYHMLKM